VAGEAVREPFIHAMVVHTVPAAAYVAAVGFLVTRVIGTPGGGAAR
jgi:hypothetical protein